MSNPRGWGGMVTTLNSPVSGRHRQCQGSAVLLDFVVPARAAMANAISVSQAACGHTAKQPSRQNYSQVTL